MIPVVKYFIMLFLAALCFFLFTRFINPEGEYGQSNSQINTVVGFVMIVGAPVLVFWHSQRKKERNFINTFDPFGPVVTLVSGLTCATFAIYVSMELVAGGSVWNDYNPWGTYFILLISAAIGILSLIVLSSDIKKSKPRNS